MKKYRNIMLIAFFAMFGIALTGCGSKSSNGQNETSENSSSSGDVMEHTTWDYFRTEDDLTHDVTGYTAYVVSTNRVRIDSNGNTARMSLSLLFSTQFSSTPSTSVMFSFTEDNKLCRLSDFQGSGILAVFDNGEVDDRWGLINMGNKRNSLFMYLPSKVDPFVEKLKTSKQVRIQVNLENVGKTTFDFNVEGLHWDWSHNEKDSTKANEEEATVEEVVSEEAYDE